jgi:hypothetical protein
MVVYKKITLCLSDPAVSNQSVLMHSQYSHGFWPTAMKQKFTLAKYITGVVMMMYGEAVLSVINSEMENNERKLSIIGTRTYTKPRRYMQFR